MDDKESKSQVPIKTAFCNKCGVEKSVNLFYREKRKKSGYNPTCKDCLCQYKKDLIEKNQKKNSFVKEKVCTKCNTLKSVNEFHRQALGEGGRSSQCKECTKKYDLGRSEKNKLERVTEKECTSCGEIKPSSEFYLCPHHKYGISSSCKECINTRNRAKWWQNREYELEKSKKFYYKNREKILAKEKKRRDNNKEKESKRSKRYYQSHKGERSSYAKKWRAERANICKEINRNWRSNNKEKTRFYSFKYRSAKLFATPPWINADHEKQMALMYILAKSLESNTGKKFEVDHIIPLCGENFCGLNVPWNLRVIPASENRSKGNKLTPELGLTAC